MIGNRAKAALLLNAASILWSTNVLLGRALRGSIGPWAMTGARNIVAGLCFYALYRIRGEHRSPPPTRRELALLTAMGLFGALGFQVLQYAGLKLTTAANAGIVNATNPVMTMLLAWLLLGVPVSMISALGALASLAGVTLVVVGSGSGGGFSVNPGDLLVLAAVLCWSGYALTGKLLLDKRDTVWVASLSTLAALPFALVPAALEVALSPPALDSTTLAAVVYIGIGPAFAAFLAWNEGVRLLGPNSASVFVNTLALYATILSALVMGEPPGVWALAGGALIVTGCVVALWRR